MPISSLDGCSEEHWVDVQSILTEAIISAGFESNLVSNADDVGIIQKRIIQNLYDNPVVVCDVSGKNPNVMFELGMRLAFDKPTIIIKDDKTAYSFDTSPIEHLEYPRDLRFGKIVEFKERLKDKIVSTYNASKENDGYTTFLKHFGEFKVAKLDKKEVSGIEFIIDELKSLKIALGRLERSRTIIQNPYPSTSSAGFYKSSFEIETDDKDRIEELNQISSLLCDMPGVISTRVIKNNNNKYSLIISSTNSISRSELKNTVESLIPDLLSKKTSPIKELKPLK